jgi:hypothetical protein
MILRRVIAHFRKQEWTAIALDFLIVVAGVFVGLQVSNWNAARAERATEDRYLVRLLADAQANIVELEDIIEAQKRRARTLADFEHALRNGGEAPPVPALQDALCRFFVQPGMALQQATYDELVASGGLSILRDERLRILLSRQQALQLQSARLDLLTPAIQRAAIPLDDYRDWTIAREPDQADLYGRVNCRFNIEGMRADLRIPNVIAQLYRDQTVNERFGANVLVVTREIDERLREVMSAQNIRPPEGPSP